MAVVSGYRVYTYSSCCDIFQSCIKVHPVIAITHGKILIQCISAGALNWYLNHFFNERYDKKNLINPGSGQFQRTCTSPLCTSPSNAEQATCLRLLRESVGEDQTHDTPIMSRPLNHQRFLISTMKGMTQLHFVITMLCCAPINDYCV